MTAIIELLASCEETVSQLYREYSKKFPELKDFWLDLAGDEIEHARLIRRLGLNIPVGNASFDEGAIKISSVHLFHDYLSEQIRLTEKEPMPLVKALSIALNIEKSILEAKYFEHFRGYTDETKDCIHRLIEENNHHRDKVQKHWEEYRKYS
jgi:rubrerythrin